LIKTGYEALVVRDAVGSPSLFPLASARQARMDRFALADSRKMRPKSMLRHPTEKRKKADTSVNLSTWCERICAPIRH